MFIAGLPMNPATNRFAGLWNNSDGGATCCRLSGRLAVTALSTATRCPRVIAST